MYVIGTNMFHSYADGLFQVNFSEKHILIWSLVCRIFIRSQYLWLEREGKQDRWSWCHVSLWSSCSQPELAHLVGKGPVFFILPPSVTGLGCPREGAVLKPKQSCQVLPAEGFIPTAFLIARVTDSSLRESESRSPCLPPTLRSTDLNSNKFININYSSLAN